MASVNDSDLGRVVWIFCAFPKNAPGSYLHHQGEFQHQLFTFRSVHDSDHGGVVRISVGQA